MSIVVTKRQVQRVRHEIVRRAVQVARVAQISPHIKSITFRGESLAGFVSDSFDDHLKLLLDTGGAEPVRRDYTPRHYDPLAKELTVEFALHGDGPAARWAAQAMPGQDATIAGPRGSFIIPVDYDWHLLVGDESALPAIARRLEELPTGSHVIAILQVGDTADRRNFATASNANVQWVSTDQQLQDAVRALDLPPGEGYAWCAGEATAMAALRRILVQEKGHDRQAIRAAAYWKRGATAHHENLED